MVNLGVKLIAGFPPPFTYEWRRGSAGGIAPGSTSVSSEYSSYYTFQTLATSTVGSQPTLYRVVVKNLANTGGLQFQFYIHPHLDLDGDGLPDGWEADYGLNTNCVADAALDPDGDGMSTWQEFIAGTDPTNQLNCLKIDSLTLTNATELEFLAMSNHPYTVEYTDDLQVAAWNRLTDLTAYATNHVETVVDPGGGTNRFYRLVVPKKP